MIGKATRDQVGRFMIVGGANTVATTLAFYVLAGLIPPEFAYTLVYAAGLLFTVAVTPRFVFRAHASRVQRTLLGVWYLVTYVVGLGVVSLLDGTFSAPRSVIVVGTLAITAPLSFLGGRLLVDHRTG